MTWQFHYFTRGHSVSAIDKMTEGWNSLGTPLEARLSEALRRLELSYNDRLRLQWRVHCQRQMLRQDWEIYERRQKYMGSPEARKTYMRVVGWLREARGRIRQLEAALR